MYAETDVGAELVGERSERESRSVICFLTWRNVLRRCGAVSTRMASTMVDAVDLVDIMDDRFRSMLIEDSELDGGGRVGNRSETTLRDG